MGKEKFLYITRGHETTRLKRYAKGALCPKDFLMPLFRSPGAAWSHCFKEDSVHYFKTSLFKTTRIWSLEALEVDCQSINDTDNTHGPCRIFNLLEASTPRPAADLIDRNSELQR